MDTHVSPRCLSPAVAPAAVRVPSALAEESPPSPKVIALPRKACIQLIRGWPAPKAAPGVLGGVAGPVFIYKELAHVIVESERSRPRRASGIGSGPSSSPKAEDQCPSLKTEGRSSLLRLSVYSGLSWPGRASPPWEDNLLDWAH